MDYQISVSSFVESGNSAVNADEIGLALAERFIGTNIPTPKPGWRNGRRSGFKNRREQSREGSSPFLGTMMDVIAVRANDGTG